MQLISKGQIDVNLQIVQLNRGVHPSNWLLSPPFLFITHNLRRPNGISHSMHFCVMRMRFCQPKALFWASGHWGDLMRGCMSLKL